ncbi:hypothetical protein FBY22_8787, partial [Streptomyces sp. SLBN-31]
PPSPCCWPAGPPEHRDAHPEFVEARRRRGVTRAHLRERAPELPAGLEAVARGPLLVLEDEYPDAWWMPGNPAQLSSRRAPCTG